MRKSETWQAKGYTLDFFVEEETGLIVHASLRHNGKFLHCFNNGYDAYDFFVEIDPSEQFAPCNLN